MFSISNILYWPLNCINRYRLTLGKRVRFVGKFSCSCPEKITIGNDVNLGHNLSIFGKGKVEIGDRVIFAANVTIYTSSHDYTADLLPYDPSKQIIKDVIIEDNVWIGRNVNIIPGVRIGEGAIIGIGTTVTGDVPKCAIVGSQKQRIIKYRDFKKYERLKKEGKVVKLGYTKK